MQDKNGIEELPKPPLTQRQVGRLRTEWKLHMNPGYQPRMTPEQREKRRQDIGDLLDDYEQQKRAVREAKNGLNMRGSDLDEQAP